MFNEDRMFEELSYELLSTFTMSEVLELNDLSEEDVIQILARGGHLREPERILSRYEAFG